MATFVLVHGAWHGGWCWAKTTAALRALGHEVHAPTLTGLGERSHLLDDTITSDSHVTDIVKVYLDAFVPEASNEAIFAKANPARMAAFQKQIDAGAIGLEPDGAIDSWTDDPAVKAWLMRMCTPHPKGTFQTGVTLTGREAEVRRRHFILAERNKPSPFWAEYERVRSREGWSSETMPTLHDAMIEAPDNLAQRLHSFADTQAKGPP